MNMEEWRDIQGYDGYYQVSNLGRVRSLDRYLPFNGTISLKKGRILKQGNDGNGYKQVNLSKDGKTKMCRVHRLVAEAFIPNHEKLPCVNHIDEDKTNNNVDNLEFCTQKYNVNFGTGIQRMSKLLKGKFINRHDQSIPIVQYTLDGTFVAEYPSITEAQRQTGIAHQSISACCLGKRKNVCGYVWRYKK